MFSFNKVAAVLGVITLISPTPVRAEWVGIAYKDNGEALEVDSQIQTRGKYVLFQQRYLFPVPNEQGVVNSEIYSAMNCRSGTNTIFQAINYDYSGGIVYDLKLPSEKLITNKVNPGSPMADIYNFVCRYKNVTEHDSRRRFINDAFKGRY